MVRALLEDEVRPLARRNDVLAQVHQVDVPPDAFRRLHGLFLAQVRIVVEVGFRFPERGVPQPQEAIDVPLLQVVFLRLHVNREIDEIGDEDAGRRVAGQVMAGLQDVQPLQDDDVRLRDRLFDARHDIVDQVPVHRNGNRFAARFHVRHRLHQPPQIIAFRKSLPLHEPPFLQDPVGKQESVRRDQVYPWVIRPPAEQGLQDPGRRAFTHRDAAADADDVGHLGGRLAEKHVHDPVQVLCRAHVQIDEPRHGQVDLGHLVEGDHLVDAVQFLQVFFGQCQRRRGAQLRPRFAGQVVEGGKG